MSTDDIEEQCVNALIGLVKTLPEFANSCEPVLDDDDMFAKMANMPRPWCGLAYEGIIARQIGISPSHKTGISAEMQFSLMFSIDALLPGQETGVIPAVRQLAKVRKRILDQQGPTGHFWQFIAEIPVGSRKSKNSGSFGVWLQRWSIPLQQSPTTPRDINSRFGTPST